jgi:hypothetical protein
VAEQDEKTETDNYNTLGERQPKRDGITHWATVRLKQSRFHTCRVFFATASYPICMQRHRRAYFAATNTHPNIDTVAFSATGCTFIQTSPLFISGTDLRHAETSTKVCGQTPGGLKQRYDSTQLIDMYSIYNTFFCKWKSSRHCIIKDRSHRAARNIRSRREIRIYIYVGVPGRCTA